MAALAATALPGRRNGTGRHPVVATMLGEEDQTQSNQLDGARKVIYRFLRDSVSFSAYIFVSWSLYLFVFPSVSICVCQNTYCLSFCLVLCLCPSVPLLSLPVM